MDNLADKDTFVEALLQERDELYQELSKLRQMDGGVLEHYEALIREKDHKISEDEHKRMDTEVQKATDQAITDIDHALATKEKEIMTV